MTTFREHLEQQLQNPDFKKEYENLRPDYEIIKAVIAEREKQHLSQKELARKTGLKQSNISRLENGNHNPSLRLLKKIASGLGKELHINFK